MHGSRGHSLVEVVVAGLLILAGLIPVGVAVGNGIQLATRGRFRAEAALGLMSRIEQLRAVAGRSSADCAALGSGSAAVRGRQERWAVGGSSTVREVAVSVSIPHPLAPVTDSVLVHLRCP